MKYVNRKTILKYLYDQLTGNFLGFLIGLSASGLVSKFFETRSIKNLWGLASKKTVVDKDTFSNLEWIISVIIGFIVFEIMTKIVREKIDRNFPLYKYKALRWIVKNNWKQRVATYSETFKSNRVLLYASMHNVLKRAFNK